MIRWYLGLGIVKNRLIGKVDQLSAETDIKGGVRPSAPWQAWGMLNDWCDTNLGNDHKSQEAARKAVMDWYKGLPN